MVTHREDDHALVVLGAQLEALLQVRLGRSLPADLSPARTHQNLKEEAPS